MSDKDHIVDLDYFLVSVGIEGQVTLLEYLDYLAIKGFIVYFRGFDIFEQITCDTIKEWNIKIEEFGHIDIINSLQNKRALINPLILPLQIPSSNKHTLNCSHSIIIVLLRRQLLGAQFIRADNLAGEATGTREPVRIEGDFGDHGVIGDHHCYGPE